MWWELIHEIFKSTLIGFVALWGLIRWRRDKTFQREMQKEQTKVTKEITGLKAEYQNKHTIHKVKFEKQFQVYEDLWKTLLSLVTETTFIDSYLSIQDKSQSHKNEAIQKLNELHDLLKETTDCIMNNKPFYPTFIFELCCTLTTDCTRLLASIIAQYKKGGPINRIGITLFSGVVTPTINKIEDAIRNEIDELKNAEIVE